MYVIDDLGEQIMREIDASSRQFSVKAINLFPPGGFYGQLPQTAIYFDPVESVDPTIPASGASLVTNLNRIRAGVSLGDGIILSRHLSSGLVIPTETQMTIQGAGGVPSYGNINTVVFPDGDLTLLSANRVQVDIQTPILDHLLNVTSGYLTRSWFMNGAVPSGVFNPAGIYQIPINALATQMTIVSETAGASDLIVTLISSENGVTWSGIATATQPASTNLTTLNLSCMLASGVFVGIQVDNSPALPSSMFENVTVILKTLEANGGGGVGGTLPTFTPRRIPFADNVTGLLTESPRFNLDQTTAGDMLIVGGDAIAALTVSEKVGIDITRDDVDGGFIQETYSNGSFAPSFAGLRARGTRDTPATVLNGTVLFRFTGRGYTDTGWSAAPTFRIEGRATEDFTSINGRGTEAIIGITKNGDTTTTDMFRVDGDGLFIAEGSVRTPGLQVTTSGHLGYVLTDLDGTGTAGWLPTVSGVVHRPELLNYNPSYLPTTPSVWDDEFDDDSIDVKWNLSSYDTSFDMYQVGGSRHASESVHHGYLTLQGDWHYQGIDFYQSFTPPDDNWTLVAKIHSGYSNTWNNLISFGVIGALYYQNYFQVRLGISEDGSIGARTFYNDGGGDAELAMSRMNLNNGVYVMLSKRLVGEDHKYMSFLSGDGISWMPTAEVALASMTTADLTYMYFGTFPNGDFDPIHAIDFVRYFPDAGHFDIGANV